MNEERLIEAFGRIAELAAALGVTRIGDLPGLWEHEIDEHWFIAVNGHPDKPIYRGLMPVQPFNAYIGFNGWPAGFALS